MQLDCPTTTVVVPLTVPAGPVAFRVYWVVAVGVTVILPERGKLPSPGVMLTETVFDVSQISSLDWPGLMLLGWALNDAIRGCAPGVGVGEGVGDGVGPGVGVGSGVGRGVGSGVGLGLGCGAGPDGPDVVAALTSTLTFAETVPPRRSFTVTPICTIPVCEPTCHCARQRSPVCGMKMPPELEFHVHSNVSPSASFATADTVTESPGFALEGSAVTDETTGGVLPPGPIGDSPELLQAGTTINATNAAAHRTERFHLNMI